MYNTNPRGLKKPISLSRSASAQNRHRFQLNHPPFKLSWLIEDSPIASVTGAVSDGSQLVTSWLATAADSRWSLVASFSATDAARHTAAAVARAAAASGSDAETWPSPHHRQLSNRPALQHPTSHPTALLCFSFFFSQYHIKRFAVSK